jgi:CRISPR system Cascade subunit CasA
MTKYQDREKTLGRRYSLLDDPFIRARSAVDGSLAHYTLPALFVAMADDHIRDFPALRAHQRHPWHALLVQLAAIALHSAGRNALFATEMEWRTALLALTPAQPDGGAWCLISPHDEPAFMQAPVSDTNVEEWKNVMASPDELDMLVTSKNHDLKAARMRYAQPDDWLFSLISLQTQEGFLGSGNYGVSRMNGGFASRPAIGVIPAGHWGRRWQRDVAKLLQSRNQTTTDLGLAHEGGVTLVWLKNWDGTGSLPFQSLDPFYIEICRRVRLMLADGSQYISAAAIGTKAARIDSSGRNGITGDPWTPIDRAAGKALTIGAEGFHYRLAADLVFGNKFQSPIAQAFDANDGRTGLAMLVQGVTRGQGKTEGYHQRYIPISAAMQEAFQRKQTDRLAAIASERVQAISTMRSSILRTALFTLMQAGKSTINFDLQSSKNQVEPYLRAFEKNEDSRFFEDLNAEIEAADPAAVRLRWLIELAARAEYVLREAFRAGPQSGERRYRARATALSRFHGALRNDKNLPTLADHLRLSTPKKEASYVTE